MATHCPPCPSKGRRKLAAFHSCNAPRLPGWRSVDKVKQKNVHTHTQKKKKKIQRKYSLPSFRILGTAAHPVASTRTTITVMVQSSQTRIWGKVNSCTLAGGSRLHFLIRTSHCTLDRRRFGLRMMGMLLALSASCVFFLCGFTPLCSKLQLAFLTDELQLSRSEASCCHD